LINSSYQAEAKYLNTTAKLPYPERLRVVITLRGGPSVAPSGVASPSDQLSARLKTQQFSNIL